MNTSVVARPMRMMASDGDGRFKKRAIAPANTRKNAVMEATKASAICQISMPYMTSSLLVKRRRERALQRVALPRASFTGLCRLRLIAIDPCCAECER